jgi:hypothetical protein
MNFSVKHFLFHNLNDNDQNKSSLERLFTELLPYLEHDQDLNRASLSGIHSTK